MIRLEVFGEAELMVAVATLLDASEGVSNVRFTEAARPGHGVVVASVRPRAVDSIVPELRARGLEEADISLTRVEVVGHLARSTGERTLVWEDVLGAAWLNARPVATYLAFMAVAGVVGCYGVLDGNGILIVGAMAVSPDLLPITAIAVAIVARRGRLVAGAFLTLVVGLAIATGTAALAAFLQEQFDLIPAGFSFGETILGSLTVVNNETIVVALAAGVAGMLALETRASAGVGVAISVTTIPAAAYLGVSIGLGGAEGLGALAVLAVNVLMLIVGSVLTLLVQRGLRLRRERAATTFTHSG